MNSAAGHLESTDARRGTTPLGDEFRPLLSLDALEWFIRLRWVFIATALALLVIDDLLQTGPRRPQQVYMMVSFLAVINVGWWNLAQSLRKRSSSAPRLPGTSRRAILGFAHAQIALDLFFLTAMLRYTGGIDSPLAIVYVFHMALGSLLLPPGHALAQGLWAVALYAGIALGELFEVVSPHYPFLPTRAATLIHLDPASVGVAIAAMACGVFGTLYLTSYIAEGLRRRERQLQETNRALQKSQTAIRDIQARRSRFMQTAAHRLKSPLATIQTLAGLIRDDIVHGADARATCERIIRNCTEGIEHVSELLTLARVQDADPRRHRVTRANVGDVVADQCNRFRTVAAGRGVRLECDIPKDMDVRAWVDPRDLADCVGNVIDNAVKYTTATGSVSVRVERIEASARTWVVVHVDDTGMGFDADSLIGVEKNKATVFDVYRRGNNALAAGIAGSGLGLAIVRVVVEQAGGEINVKSSPGAGTQFTLMFPADGVGAASLAVRDTRSIHTIVDDASPMIDSPLFMTDDWKPADRPAEEPQHAHC